MAQLDAPLPSAFESWLTDTVGTGPIRYRLASDLRPDGHAGVCYLAASETHVAVGDGEGFRRAWPLKDLKKVRIDELYSGARLTLVHATNPKNESAEEDAEEDAKQDAKQDAEEVADGKGAASGSLVRDDESAGSVALFVETPAPDTETVAPGHLPEDDLEEPRDPLLAAEDPHLHAREDPALHADDGPAGADPDAALPAPAGSAHGDGEARRPAAAATVGASNPTVSSKEEKEDAEDEGLEEPLILYSRALASEFALFQRVLEQLIEGKPVALPEEPVGASHCIACGRPLPERGGQCLSCVSRWASLRKLIALLAPYRGRMVGLIALTFITVAARIVMPLVSKVLIDDIIRPQKLAGLDFWIGVLVAALTVTLVTEVATGWVSMWLAGRLVTDLRNRLHAHLQNLRLAYFGKRDSGELVGRVMHDTMLLQHFLVDGVPFLLVNTLMFFGILGILLYIDPIMTGLVAIPVPVLFVGGRLFFRKIHTLRHRWGTLVERLHTILGESIKGIKPIKACNRQGRRIQAFDGHGEELFGVALRMETTFLGFRSGMMYLMQLGVAACWYVGARRIVGGAPLTTGDLVAFVGLIWLFYGPLQWFGVILNWMTHAMAGAERIFAVLDTRAEDYDDPRAVALPSIEGRITFEEARFGYERGKEVLKGIDLEIAPGEMIGLVGKSGVGKSTLINLLCRFYDLDSGTVRVDGHDIRTLKLDQYRRRIGIVMQEPFLFRGTILDNIRFAQPEASFAQVVAAARASHAHEFIVGKEDGYDTIIGEGGLGLSGGEKQRISIARAILHDPPILILDEATSSVDVETEKRIQDAITKLVRNRTTIAIAHRLSTLRNANRLVVLDDGKVAEVGTHEELLATEGGIYRKLVETQRETNRMRDEQAVWNE